MIREFFLKNASGQILNLNDFAEMFIHSVAGSGLGYTKKLKVKQIGSHFEVVKTESDPGVVPGVVHFTAPGAYDKYFDFVQFCSVSPLTLIYNPCKYVQTGNDLQGYRRECILTDITKDFGKVRGDISGAIKLTCTTPWYEVKSVLSDPMEAAETKAYGPDQYEFPITFPISTSNTVEMDSDSHIETGSPCRLRIYGPITDPAWTQYVNNKEVVTGSVTANIASGNYLEIDTINGRSIKQYTNAGVLVSDLYQQADFSKKRFIMLMNGKNRVTVTSQGGEDVRISLEGRIEYESV